LWCHERASQLELQHGPHIPPVLTMRHALTISCLVVLVAIVVGANPASAQIRVNPTGVNVSSQGATTVFLTFGPLDGYVPVESLWCGDLSAVAGVGVQCD